MIIDFIMVNGIWVVSDDGIWGLVRVFFNKLELVVVVESFVFEEWLYVMFKVVDVVLRENLEVGEYN